MAYEDTPQFFFGKLIVYFALQQKFTEKKRKKEGITM